MQNPVIDKFLANLNSLLENFVLDFFGPNGMDGKKIVARIEEFPTGQEFVKKESNKERKNKLINLQVNKLYPVSSNTSITNINNKISCKKTNPCGQCSKCSLIACTSHELWEIAVQLKISEKDVKNKHTTIMDLINSGEFKIKYKKDKTVFNTLKNWLRMGKERGFFQELDEDAYLTLKSEPPEKKDASYKLMQAAIAKGIL